jgi:hypothetical protein
MVLDYYNEDHQHCGQTNNQNSFQSIDQLGLILVMYYLLNVAQEK